eukprot:m.15269 g.15269  ORF g.15269 m.15269 type:complete len:106 (+) comp3247_c0_seq1:120-437(+)
MPSDAPVPGGLSLSSFVGGVLGGAAMVGALHVMGMRGGATAATQGARAITRLGTSDPRSSAVVIRDGLVTISGQVAEIDKLAESDIFACVLAYLCSHCSNTTDAS